MLDGCYWMCRLTSLRPPRAKATHIFSHARRIEDNVNGRDHLSPSADSQVIKSPSATIYQLPHT